MGFAGSETQQAALALVTLLPPGAEHLALAALTFALSTPSVQQAFEAASKHLSFAGPAVSPGQLCNLLYVISDVTCLYRLIDTFLLWVAVTPSSSSDLVMTRNPALRTAISTTSAFCVGRLHRSVSKYPKGLAAELPTFPASIALEISSCTMNLLGMQHA